MKPAIVVGTHTMGLGVIRALGMMNVPIVAVYYDRDRDMGYVSKYVSHKVYAPHPEQAEEEFLNLLRELGLRFGGGMLIPVSDQTLVTVSRHKDLLARHYVVACTEWNITKQLIDKKHTYALAEAVGVAAPKTVVPQSLEEVERYGKTIEYPCLVKPCQSHLFFAQFRRKMVPVWNLDQMISIYQRSADAGIDVTLQEIIPGDDNHVVNYNSYFWDGQPLIEFTAQHVRNAPPQFGSPCVAVSKYIPEVIEPGRKILGAMGFYGYSCTEFKKDSRDGIYKLMEVNGRHNLSTLLAVNCGINFPWLHYHHLIDGVRPESVRFQEDLYWIDMERDLPYIPERILRQKESLSQIVKPYVHSHVSAVFDLKDIKPFIKRYADFSKQTINYLHRQNKS
jgi:predicted ATP-grasp superfamily ATP-dependent carboligase